VRTVTLSDRALVRLIPATYHKPPALRGLVDSDNEMAVLAELEGLTSARLEAERGRSLHIDRRELAWERRRADLALYGLTHVNAAFAYTRAGGNRFNDERRGAWYCAWNSLTSVAEVAYHRTRELSYVGRWHDRARYVELLADFIGDFPSLDDPSHPALHRDPAIGYPAGQALAAELMREGARGLVYPSVRAPGGRCLAAFVPASVQNVRPGASWDLLWQGTPDWSAHAA
jgi:RES domain-containing protein